MPLSHLEPAQRRTVAILGREGMSAHVEHIRLRPPDDPGYCRGRVGDDHGYYRIGLSGVIAFITIPVTDDEVVEFAREMLYTRVARLMDKVDAS